jgi:hypothetical protein
MCHEIEATVEDLRAKGAEFSSPIEDQGWGRIAQLRVPGAGEIGLYEPRHPSPLQEFAQPADRGTKRPETGSITHPFAADRVAPSSPAAVLREPSAAA